MKEKYESLALVDLKEIAKARGLRGISTMKKAQLIELMLQEDEKEKRTKSESAASVSLESRKVQEEGNGRKTSTAKKAIAKEDVVKENSKEGEPTKETIVRKGSTKGRLVKEDSVKEDSAKEDSAKESSVQEDLVKESPVKETFIREGLPKEGFSKEGFSKENFMGGYTRQEGIQGLQVQREGMRRQGDFRGTAGRNQTEGRRGMENRFRNEEGGGEVVASQYHRYERSQNEMRGQYNRSQNDIRGQYERSQNEVHGQYNRSQNETRGQYERSQNETQGQYNRSQNEARGQYERSQSEGRSQEERYPADLDSGIVAHGILEVMPDGYGFIRCENYLPGENDVYVAPSQIRRFGLKTGDMLEGNTRIKTQSEKFSALLYVKTINGYIPEVATRRKNFEDMTPIFPNERLSLETQGASVAMRIMDLISPVGKGQRGMIVSPPKAGKTTLLKEVAKSIKKNSPDVHLIILLIDERPEEVTDIKEAIEGPNVEVIYSTFDELPEHHKRVSEMVIERAKRLVEHKQDVMILLDSITRLTRAYNLTVPPSGRTLSGGLDPAALHMPKRFFGAARNMRDGGSLTILATALVETGSKMDDVVYEEFKGTGNMEMVLDRKLSERRVFPAIDIPKSGTRREDLLLSAEEHEAVSVMRKALNGLKSEEAVDKILDMFSKTRSNAEFVQIVQKMKFF